MHAYSDYTIKMNGTNEELSAVINVLAKAFSSIEFDDDVIKEIISSKEFRIEETYEVTFIEDIKQLALDMAKAAPGMSFVIKGVIDTSESAGEYMDFEIDYKQKELETKYSNWYLYPDGDVEDMSCEEYCDEYDCDYSEEDFAILRNGGFIVETGNGDIVVKQVPLSNIDKDTIG